jgi:hypothetical protein
MENFIHQEMALWEGENGEKFAAYNYKKIPSRRQIP